MDIHNLAAFITVNELGSFSRAAEKLFITQPAVSKRVSALESELNTRLFDRIGKKVQLTQAGQALLPGALRILAELEESKRAIGNLDQRVDGTLKIATSHHIGLHRLPSVLRAYTRDYPEVDLDIRFMDSEEACQQVLKGEVEIAIATLPEEDWPNLSSRVVWHDPLSFVIYRGQQGKARTKMSIKELQGLPAILPSRNTFTRVLLEQALGLNEQNLNIAMETNYLETIKMLVSIGLGWSVLPLSMLNDELTRVDIEGVEFERLLGVVIHEQRTLSNAADRLLSMLNKTQE